VNPKITTHPQNAMQAAWLKAAQRRATEKPPRKVPKNPAEVAVMVFECVGNSEDRIAAAQLFERATAKGWDITREFAVKAAKWHTDYLKGKS
jgi:hypothetical protein